MASARTSTDLAIEFDAPQPAVGAWVGRTSSSRNDPADRVTMRVYGAGRTLLESIEVPLPATPDVPTFVGLARPEGIRQVEWIGHNTGFFAVDDVRYGAVPEPAATLAGAVFIPAILLRRRRHRPFPPRT